MTRGYPGSEAPGQATKQGNAIKQLCSQPEWFRSRDFTLAYSPFIVCDLIDGRSFIDQCWQRSDPAAQGQSRVDFEVFRAHPV